MGWRIARISVHAVVPKFSNSFHILRKALDGCWDVVQDPIPFRLVWCLMVEDYRIALCLRRRTSPGERKRCTGTIPGEFDGQNPILLYLGTAQDKRSVLFVDRPGRCGTTRRPCLRTRPVVFPALPRSIPWSSPPSARSAFTTGNPLDSGRLVDRPLLRLHGQHHTEAKVIVGMIGILRPAKIGGIAVRHAAVAVLAVIPVAAAHAPVGLAVRHQAAARGAWRVVGRAVGVVIAPIPVVDELPDVPGHVIKAVTICPI